MIVLEKCKKSTSTQNKSNRFAYSSCLYLSCQNQHRYNSRYKMKELKVINNEIYSVFIKYECLQNDGNIPS
jgi:hypothetical protein